MSIMTILTILTAIKTTKIAIKAKNVTECVTECDNGPMMDRTTKMSS